MQVLNELEFAILDRLAYGLIVGRDDVEIAARGLGVSVMEIDKSMARLGVARLVSHAGPLADRKWQGTDLWLRRAEVRDVLDATPIDTASITRAVGGEHSNVYADLRWWEGQGKVQTHKVKSDERLFFCADCLDTYGKFIVITKATYPRHRAMRHRFASFHPWVREWWWTGTSP